LNYSYFKEDDFLKILASVNYRPVDYFSVIGSFPDAVAAGNANIEFGQPAQERTAGAPDNFDTVGVLKVVRSVSERVDYLLKTNVALTSVTVKGEINIYLQNPNVTSSSFRMHIYKTDYSTGTTTSIYTGETKTIGAGANNTFTYVINASFDIEAGMVLYLVLRRTSGSDVVWMQQGGQPLTIDYQYLTSQFTVKGLNLYEVGKQLISKATDGTATLQSQLLTEAITYAQGIDCRPDSTLILSGDSIIGITDPTIKISLKDYLKAIDCWFCAGLGVEDNKVVIEKRSYFFKREVSGNENIIAHFSKLANWIIEDAVDIR
jgi:hypothetical protein